MRILYLTHRLPYADNRGDRIRARRILQHLSRHAEVDLVSFVHDREEEAHAADMVGLAASVTVARLNPVAGYLRAAAGLLTGLPSTHAIFDAPGLRRACERIVATRRPDVVLAYCSSMARFAMEPPLKGLPFVLDMTDVDSEKWRALAQTASAPMRWIYAREAGRLAAFEAHATREARAVLVVNEREQETLQRLEPSGRVVVVPIGVAVDEFRCPDPSAAGDTRRVVFCGVMNYGPNEQGAIWFAEHVWPAVRARHPDAVLTLVGSDPTPAVRALTSADRGIEVTGSVPDVRPFLWRAAVSVAPLFVSRGIQNKVLEAVAAGLPVVVTPGVAEGLPKEVASAVVVAADAEAFRSAVIDLLEETPASRRAIAASARLDGLRWDARLAGLMPIIEQAAR